MGAADDRFLGGAVRDGGGHVLSGRLAGFEWGTLTLVVNGDVVAHTVRTLEATYRIRPKRNWFTILSDRLEVLMTFSKESAMSLRATTSHEKEPEEHFGRRHYRRSIVAGLLVLLLAPLLLSAQDPALGETAVQTSDTVPPPPAEPQTRLGEVGDVLLVFLVLSVIFEVALTPLFNWRVFVARYGTCQQL